MNNIFISDMTKKTYNRKDIPHEQIKGLLHLAVALLFS